MLELFSIKGKVALVTGGTRGIGYMIAEAYLRAGAKVYISSRKAEACEKAQAELSKFGDVHAIACDVSTDAQCKELINEISKYEKHLDILVNNAGTNWSTSIENYDDNAWEKVLSVNVKTPFHLVKYAKNLLEAAAKDGDPARVINIGSIDGLEVPNFPNYAYSTSKAAIHHLTRHLAGDLAPKILVNAIAPGPFPSKMTEKLFNDMSQKQLDTLTRVGRIGNGEDMAGIAIYLASRASSFVTGAIIPVDGGMSTTQCPRV